MQAVDAIVADWTRLRPGVEVEALLQQAGVPVSRVLTVEDIFADPHYRARDMIATVEHPQLGSTRQVGVVPKLSRSPGRIRHTGPALGGDSASVLASELGLEPQAIAALIASGIVRGSAQKEY
ncbi:Bile acid-CoA hydrolase [compost metagenome]